MDMLVASTRLSTPKRYLFGTQQITSPVAAGTNILGLRKLAANPVCRFLYISIIIENSQAGLMPPVSIYRAVNVAGVAATPDAANELDSLYPLHTLQIISTPTGTIAAQRILTFGGGPSAAAITSGPTHIWRARDVADAITLRGDEGLMFVQELGGDNDSFLQITFLWEEE